MSLPEGYAIRRATANDINTLVAHRRAMFVHMGYQDEEAFGRNGPPNVTPGCMPG